MDTGKTLPSFRGIRLRIRVDGYEGHPKVPPGTVVNVLGDPESPDFLVVELDAPIEVDARAGDGKVTTQHLAVSGYGWKLREMLDPPPMPSPWFVKVWHVYDASLGTATEWRADAMQYVAKGGMSRFIPGDGVKRGAPG